ncbi:neuron navigator 2 isoform X2 [Hypomesus transpacificus]|nr:neuron navigator 2 isoform X2 [Hypomesus transpacificus]XP_046890285.1 neuron navigator 2 isoform X2 [Hypomesus transpacificus]XP_046890286.1 neuron navigator 2 isoform X2 [Hypomesus transpacificus]
MTELAPSPAPSSSSSSSSQANASISSKAWRSKSLSAKHSSTSTLLSVKQDLPPCQAPPPQASPRQAPLEVPSKVIAQKSMLEKLKLFNSKSGSKGGGGSVGARPETPPGLDPERGQRGQSCPGLELHLEVEGNSRPPSAIARPTTPTSTSSTASSPKLALKGIAQRTFSRALTPRRSSLKPGEKDKARPKERDKAGGSSRAGGGSPRAGPGPEEEGPGEGARLVGVGSEAEKKNTTISSLIPKGGKIGSTKKESLSPSSTLAGTGIPKPGGKAGKAPSGGRDGELRGRVRASSGLSVHRAHLESRSSSPCSSLGSSESRCPHQPSGAAVPLVASDGATLMTSSIQLPRPEQLHSHPNTATVAPFMYRSQPDVTGAIFLEAGAQEGNGRPVAFSQSAHNSLEDLTGEDPEARRLRTVKNIADLRQNLEETMSCLRGTQISHSTLETTFDDSVTTEISRGGKAILNMPPRPASTLPWRLGASSPRLQAGDAPSTVGSYGVAAGGGVSRVPTPKGGKYLRRPWPAGRDIGDITPDHALLLADKMEELEGITVETTGYVSDGELLGKNARMDHMTSGYMTDGGVGIYTQRPANKEVLQHTTTSPADTDSWDDSSSVSSGISDTFDTDDITSSSVSSYMTTPCVISKDIQVSPIHTQLQTDVQKHSTVDCNAVWPGAEVKRSDGGSDSGVRMEPGSRWGRHPSDLSDESDRSSTGRRTPSHTASWRRGMSAQVGVTSARATAPIVTANNGSLKSHGTGKTDDAKVSERGCLSPRPNGLQRSPSDMPGGTPANDAKKPPSSSRTPTATNTFGFKKNGGALTMITAGGVTMVTASGVTITSGSATLGKTPKSSLPLGGHGVRTLGRQTSVDDGYLSASGRHSTLQYRSLPRPSRSSGTGAVNGSRGSATLRSPSGSMDPSRSTTLQGSRGRGGVAKTSTLANQTDREKGVSVEGGLTPQGMGTLTPQGGRQTGGKYADVSSPTLRRLFGGGVKPGKQAPVTTMENMKNSTVISNPHTSSVQQGGALESPSASASSSSPLYGVGGGAGGRGGLEPTLSPLASSPGSALSTPSQSHSLAWSPASPSPSLGYPGGYPSLGSLATSTESMDVSLVSAGGGVVGGHHGGARDEGPAGCVRNNGVRTGYSDSPLSSPSASPKFSRNTLPRKQDRYAHLPALRGHEEPRDWLRSHSAGGLQDSSSSFSQGSSLSSPSGSRFNFSQLGSPIAAAHMTLGNLRSTNGLANQEGANEPSSDTGLRSSCMSLEERSRTMSSSTSFRDGLEEVHGSSLSLVSSTSSVYSTPEEKSQSEIRKLRRELEASQEKVSTLTTQLSANAHLVSAFEQSLGNMTIRLQSLTTSSEQKDSELGELRKTIEYLKKQNSAAQAAINGVINSPELTCTTDAPTPGGMSPQSPQSELRIHRQHSSDSVSSITSATSQSSLGSSLDLDAKNKKKKKNWLRSSFKQAFGKKKSPKSASSHSDMEEMLDSSLPSSPKLPYHASTTSTPALRTSLSNSLISESVDSEAEMVMQLRSELREKEMKLTDIRLEALSSAHQLDQLRESMNRMQVEMERLQQENERLKTDSQGSSGPSQAAIVSPLNNQSQHTLGLTESTSLDMLLEDNGEGSSRKEGRHVKVVVSLDQDATWREEGRHRQFLIGCIGVSGKTKWDVLDGVVRRLFKEYIINVDPAGQLGLGSDSVLGYSIGEVQRTSGTDTPELLPCGYLVGESDTITVSLKGVCVHSEDSLVFETLIPRPIMQRFVSQLQEHRRIILSGPSGTGKSFLAIRLAEHMIQREGQEVKDGLIATFNVDHKSSKELRQYLCNLAEHCNSRSQQLDRPLVVILDNLHHIPSLGELFNGLLSSKHQPCPFIIGTMNQTSSATPNLQLHHNFRWVLCANHTEPVKGFLGRFLRRKLLEMEISSRVRNGELVKIMEWIPRVWLHLNHFLETHSSSDVTIGPRLFLSCPMDVGGSRVWFTDLWNYSIIPYMLEAVREGLQLFGRRAGWEDPSQWVMETFPWSSSPQQQACPPLLQLRPQDVGFDGYALSSDGCPSMQSPQRDKDTDPLMSMLMRLKEAAHSSGPQSYDSDSNSNDHHDDPQLDPSLESSL